MRCVAGVLLLSAVACHAYRPGAVSGPTVGCLDVGVERHTDSEAEGPVAAYTIGNRCDAAVVVDLGAVRATAGGEAVAPYDPRGEIGPRVLEARSVARENIEYGAASGGRLCLDLSGLDPAAGATGVEVCL